jgi:hypothetical protein
VALLTTCLNGAAEDPPEAPHLWITSDLNYNKPPSGREDAAKKELISLKSESDVRAKAGNGNKNERFFLSIKLVSNWYLIDTKSTLDTWLVTLKMLIITKVISEILPSHGPTCP